MEMIDNSLNLYIDELIFRYPLLASVRKNIEATYILLENCYKNKNKILIAGNGGSAADAEHIVGELMKGFKKKRNLSDEFVNQLKDIEYDRGKNLAQNLEMPLRAMALVTHEALSTAFSNDVDGKYVFAQQLFGYGDEGDIFLGISTSGNSENIINAAIVAKAKKMVVIGMTGECGGELKKFSDVIINVPENETYRIQELHLPIYHCLCLMLERRFF